MTASMVSDQKMCSRRFTRLRNSIVTEIQSQLMSRVEHHKLSAKTPHSLGTAAVPTAAVYSLTLELLKLGTLRCCKMINSVCVSARFVT